MTLVCPVRLPEEIEDRLDTLALRTGHSVEYYLLEAILEYLDDIEARQSHLERIEAQQLAGPN